MAKKIATVEVPAQTHQVEVLVCDFCGYESQHRRGVRACVLCGRHVCNSAKRCAHSDPNDYSDYPDWYCRTCYELRFETYATDFVALKKEYEAKKAALLRRVKDESLSIPASFEKGGQ